MLLDSMTLLPLFGYGTLLDPELVGHLLERSVEGEAARLVDYEIVDGPELKYPVAFESPGETAEGMLYRDLTEEDFERLDAYGGVLEGLYQRVEAGVTVGHGQGVTPSERAYVYLPTDRTLRSLG